MSPFVFLKVIHVLAAIVAVGANVSYAFWLRTASHDRDRLTWAIQGVRRLDRRVANPGYVVLLVTGVLMVSTGAYSFADRWLQLAIVLYALAAVVGISAFAPAIRRQLAEAERDPLSPAYAAAARRATGLGLFTTGLVVVIVILMVAKPF
ncbi:MAG: DUF2269 family protein [Candidatus Limnocylindrales bacterium]